MLIDDVKYVRILLTNKCNLSCKFCHKEGCDFINQDIDLGELCNVLSLLYNIGYRKIKLMGGEPMLYPRIKELLREIKQMGTDIDVSMISNGSASVTHYENLFSEGLDRLNVSVHGWNLEYFIENTSSSELVWKKINSNITYLSEHNYINKLNYVLKKGVNEKDFLSLLDFAGEKHIVVDALNLLLSSANGDDKIYQYKFRQIEELIQRHYKVIKEYEYINPYSINSKRLVLSNGAEVNLKVNELNIENIFFSCKSCIQRLNCIEGIKAIRITNNLTIQPCLLRNDNCLDLKKVRDNREIIDYLHRL